MHIRKLYWLQSENTTWHSLVAAEIDGASPNILSNFTERPHGLTVDVNDSRVYWITERYIASILPDGTGFRKISLTIGLPRGLVLFQEDLFICSVDPRHSLTQTISSIDKVTGARTTLNSDQNNWCQDISVFHSSLHQGKA